MSAARACLIVKTGDADRGVRDRRGDFEDLFAAGLAPLPLRVVDPRLDGPRGALPDPAAIAAAVVTGSMAMATNVDPWADGVRAWLREAVRVGTPVLGVCYGHQVLAQALGGTVDWNPRGREIGTVRVALAPAAREDALLGGLPDELVVQASHSQSVLRLPGGAVRLAGNALDPHQAFRFGATTWGLQFHPEFDANVTRSDLAEHRALLEAEGLDVAALLADARDSNVGARILARFAAMSRT